jgi:hypothetical protein
MVGSFGGNGIDGACDDARMRVKLAEAAFASLQAMSGVAIVIRVGFHDLVTGV